MRRFALAAALLIALAAVSGAGAEDGNSARASRRAAAIGEQFTLTIEVLTAPDATVEIDPAAPAWRGVEVVRLLSAGKRTEGDRVRHVLTLTVAAFAPGEIAFEPVVSVIASGSVTRLQLPAVALRVASSLAPDDPLELTPLPPPAAIGGAESPFLRPAIALGVLALAVVLGGLVTAAVRSRRNRPLPFEPERAVPQPVLLDEAEALIDRDPIAAYRKLGLLVRAALGERYRFPARALTTTELGRRMEAAGVDRWQARLVTGLLQECDAVVYAGYRPASERRHADLTMAREIVEAG